MGASQRCIIISPVWRYEGVVHCCGCWCWWWSCARVNAVGMCGVRGTDVLIVAVCTCGVDRPRPNFFAMCNYWGYADCLNDVAGSCEEYFLNTVGTLALRGRACRARKPRRCKCFSRAVVCRWLQRGERETSPCAERRRARLRSRSRRSRPAMPRTCLCVPLLCLVLPPPSVFAGRQYVPLIV